MRISLSLSPKIKLFISLSITLFYLPLSQSLSFEIFPRAVSFNLFISLSVSLSVSLAHSLSSFLSLSPAFFFFLSFSLSLSSSIGGSRSNTIPSRVGPFSLLPCTYSLFRTKRYYWTEIEVSGISQRYSGLLFCATELKLRLWDCVIHLWSYLPLSAYTQSYTCSYKYTYYRTSPGGVEVLTMPNGLYQLARRLCIVLNQSKLSDVLLMNAVRCTFCASLLLLSYL